MFCDLSPYLKTAGTVLAWSMALIVPVHAQSGGAWRTLAPMPSKRQELATAVLDGKIYVIGGYDIDGNSTATVEVYDPHADTWASAHAIPIAVNHNSAAVAAGKLYSFGAAGLSAHVYNPANDTWASVAAMNFEHGGTAAVGVIAGKIYVAGGAGSSMRQLEVYDPVANTWTILAPMAVGRNHTGGGVIDGKFYVVGGRGTTSAPTALEVYDPQTNSWSSRAPMPTGRSGIGVAAVNGELWVFGGEVPVLHGEVEVYNPVTNTWRSLPDMPTPRHGISAAVIGNGIYMPGGGVVQGYGASDVSEVFIVAIPTFTQWQQLHFTPEELSNPTVSGENADPNHNGLTNLLDYAFTNDPRAVTTKFRPFALREQTTVSLVYPQSVSATDLTCTLEQSSSLANWTVASPANLTLSDDGVTRLIKSQVPISEQRQFLRLRVSHP
jgi:N-acetylneuraminic acid mutarotase